MNIAAGSASETEYHLLLACDLNYIQDETYRELNQQVNEAKRMLSSFIQKLTAKEINESVKSEDLTYVALSGEGLCYTPYHQDSTIKIK